MNSSQPSEIARRVEARAKQLLLAEAGLKLTLLYGSMAAGKPRPDSDVDLAVLFSEPMTASAKMELCERLEVVTGRPVDLLDLSTSNGTILKQVLREGKVLLQDGPNSRVGQIHKMIFNQADMMPYTTRALMDRQLRFTHG